MSGEPTYKVGDWVLLYYPPIANKKLGLKFLGPFKVTRQINEVSYEIEAPQTGKKKNVNVNHLKPYICEVMPDDLASLPDIPRNLDLDGLLPDSRPNSNAKDNTDADPPIGNMDHPHVDLDPQDLSDDRSDGDCLFQSNPKRARRPPERLGHNVGYN